jgi:hypothetical protein
MRWWGCMVAWSWGGGWCGVAVAESRTLPRHRQVGPLLCCVRLLALSCCWAHFHTCCRIGSASTQMSAQTPNVSVYSSHISLDVDAPSSPHFQLTPPFSLCCSVQPFFLCLSPPCTMPLFSCSPFTLLFKLSISTSCHFQTPPFAPITSNSTTPLKCPFPSISNWQQSPSSHPLAAPLKNTCVMCPRLPSLSILSLISLFIIISLFSLSAGEHTDNGQTIAYTLSLIYT